LTGNREEMKPTEEQVRRFWEWCGLKQNRYTGDWYSSPDTKVFPRPVLDLNNLFKYAVPKVDGYKLATNPEIPDTVYAEIRMCNRYFTDRDTEPALALFWAIYKVIDGNNTPAER